MIHCFALAIKTLPSGLQQVRQDVMQIVNYISANATTFEAISTSRLFEAFGEEVGSDYKALLLHTKVWWLSHDKVLNHLLQLREETLTFFFENE